MSHLLWLLRRTLLNRVRAMAARLRSPRYLAALLVGVAYLGFLFLPQIVAGAPGAGAMPAVAVNMMALGVAVWLLFWWVRGGYQEAVAFDPSEVHQLFPAPLRRTTLIHYKLIKAQAGLVPAVLFFWIIGVGRSLPWYLALISLWIVMETLHLHQVGASLVRITAARGRGGLRRAAAPLALILVLGIVVVWTGVSAFRAFGAAAEPAAALAAAAAALERPVPSVALAPFRALLAPLRAAGPSAWLAAVPVALLILMAHYIWVLRMDAAFEEAAAEAGRRQARVRAAMRQGRGWWKAIREETGSKRRRLRPPIRPTGEPAVALAWKHAVAFTGELSVPLVIIGLLAVGVVGTVAVDAGSIRTAGIMVAVVCAMLAGMTVLLGPAITRLDFRRDLEMVEVLRTYPIDSRWLVTAELAAPVLVLTGVYALLLMVALAATLAAGPPPGLLRLLPGLALVALAAGPVLVALQVAIHNLITLLFPDWVRIGPTAHTGIDAMGQGILVLLAAALLFVALLLPVMVVAGLVGASFGPVLRQWSLVPAGLTLLGGLCAEVVVLGRWIVRLYDRLDPVEAGLLR